MTKRKSVITRNYRLRNYNKGKCIYCGVVLNENDFRVGCRKCRHKNNIRENYRRHFEADFK